MNHRLVEVDLDSESKSDGAYALTTSDGIKHSKSYYIIVGTADRSRTTVGE